MKVPSASIKRSSLTAPPLSSPYGRPNDKPSPSATDRQPAAHHVSEGLDQRRGDTRALPAPPGLRIRHNLGLPLRGLDLLAHVHDAALPVDVLPAQPQRLATAQARAGDHQPDRPIRAALGGHEEPL